MEVRFNVYQIGVSKGEMGKDRRGNIWEDNGQKFSNSIKRHWSIAQDTQKFWNRINKNTLIYPHADIYIIYIYRANRGTQRESLLKR